jgi:hypothetical protein
VCRVASCRVIGFARDLVRPGDGAGPRGLPCRHDLED